MTMFNKCGFLVMLLMAAPAFAGGPPASPPPGASVAAPPGGGTGDTVPAWDGDGTSLRDSTLSIAADGFWTNTATLNNATGDEYGYRFLSTTNKATSGNDTTVIISGYDISSPGVTELFNVGANTDGTLDTHTTKYRINTNGDVYSTGNATFLSYVSANGGFKTINLQTLTLQDWGFATTDDAIEAVSGTHTQGLGESFRGLVVNPTYNQTDDASAIDLWIDRTTTAVGTGVQRFFGASDNGDNKFWFDVSGRMFQKEATTPTAVTGYGAVYPKSDGQYYYQNTVSGNEHRLGPNAAATPKTFHITTQGLGSGTFYSGGFYEASDVDANLTQVATTVTFGDANHPYAAHAFVLLGGACTTDASTVSLTVSGTSISDSMVRTAADSEVITTDCTGASPNDYLETTKRWLGTYTITMASAGATAFAADFNYGYAQYADLNSQDYIVKSFGCVGLAGANDAGFDLELLYHRPLGWTYAATGFVPGDSALIQTSTILAPEDDLTNGQHFVFEAKGLSDEITASAQEGVLIRVTTTQNNSIEYIDCTMGVWFVQ